MRRTLATEPARRVGPCITLASSSVSPSSLGSPPKPTDVSLGSSSTTVTAAIAASSVSPPFCRTSMPRLRACSPFVLEMITGRLLATGAGDEILRASSGFSPSAGVLPKSEVAPAAALPAREVRKNFRRDQSPIRAPLPRVLQGLPLKRLLRVISSKIHPSVDAKWACHRLHGRFLLDDNHNTKKLF